MMELLPEALRNGSKGEDDKTQKKKRGKDKGVRIDDRFMGGRLCNICGGNVEEMSRQDSRSDGLHGPDCAIASESPIQRYSLDGI